MTPEQFMCELTPRERMAFWHLLEGNSSKVAGYAMGIDGGTVTVLWSRCYAKLKKHNMKLKVYLEEA